MVGYTSNLNSFIQRTTNIHPVFESLLSAILIQAWTTFEILCQQLHLTSTKLHRECFPHLTGHEAFGFQRRDTLRASFREAFLHGGSIKNVLDDQSVDSLALIRNLLVHKAGVVDGAFKRECEKLHFAKWASLDVGSRFEPDGADIRLTVDRNVQAGIR